MKFRVQILSDAEGNVMRELVNSYDRPTAEKVAKAVPSFLHRNKEPGAGYGIQIVDDHGRWIWRRPFSLDGESSAVERPQ